MIFAVKSDSTNFDFTSFYFSTGSDPNPGPRHDAVPVTIYKGKGGDKYSMGIRLKEIDGNCGPGPQSSITPLDVYRNRAPKYPMFGPFTNLSDGKSPGPNKYPPDLKNKTMHTMPAYSLRGKATGGRPEKAPGPAEYNLMKHNPFENAPAYSHRRYHSEFAGVKIVPKDNACSNLVYPKRNF